MSDRFQINMAPIIGLFVIFTLLQVYEAQVVPSCNQENINACWAPIDSYLNAIKIHRNNSDSFALFKLNEGQLTEFCSLWDSSSSKCLAGLRGSCSKEIKLQFEGIEDGWDFMCSSIKRLQTFKNCLSKIQVVFGVVRCDNQFHTNIMNAYITSKTPKEADKKVCNAVGDSINCEGDLVAKQCGTDAADWIKEYNKRYLSPYFDGITECSDAGFCTHQNIEKCWVPINTYLKSINKGDIDTIDFMFESLDNPQLTQFCIKYHANVNTCLKGLLQTCNEYERRLFEGQFLALEYLCNEGLTEYTMNRHCFANNSDFQHCDDEYDKAIRSATMQTSSKTDIDMAYCKAINKVVDCYQSHVDQLCGTTAGLWMKEYKLRRMQPYYDGIQCANILTLSCEQQNIDACWKDVNIYKKTEGFSDRDGFALYHLTETQLRKYCRIYANTVSDCLFKIKPYCTEDTRKKFEGIEDSLDYLCKESLEEYVQHKSCIGSSNVQTGIFNCGKEFNKDITNILTKDTTRQQLNDLYCTAVEDNLQCDSDVVDTECGSSAGNWVREYQRRYLEPYLEHVGCSVGGLSSGIKALIAIIIIGCIGASVFGIIFLWHYNAKRKKTQQQTEHTRFENPLATVPEYGNATYNGDSAVNIETLEAKAVDNQVYGRMPSNTGDLADGPYEYANTEYIDTTEVKPKSEDVPVDAEYLNIQNADAVNPNEGDLSEGNPGYLGKTVDTEDVKYSIEDHQFILY